MVRTPNLGSLQNYAPSPVPQSIDDLPIYLSNELEKISTVISALTQGHLDVSYSAPSKPRKGDIRYADGTSWNPGSGQGIYRYTGSAWVFVG